LRQVPWRRWRRSENPEELRRKNGIRWIDGKIFGKYNNCWFELTLEKDRLESGKYGPVRRSYDVFFKTSYLCDSNRILFYGSKDLVCCAKRQLNKREIRRLRLNQKENLED
jgi:hypothetical protein